MSEGSKSENRERSRFVVGIDLGTTNSAVCYVEASNDDWTIDVFAIVQTVAAGQVERRETLPSFHYEPAERELPESALRLPWTEDEEPTFGVGVFARDHGRAVPGRLISSAKSWLCHPGVDRRAALLPWHGAADVQSLSPVEVSSRYIRHIRDAWNAEHPDDPLEQQDVVLTIPASFDEVARELTVAAAKAAGLPRVVLIEEPQAAFYSWVNAHRVDWEEHVAPGQKILVCDIGGGTSDFTLIHVRRDEHDKIQFHRVAVGDHLILGGDNLDLALAHHIEKKLAGENGKLEPRQWSVLVPTCRHAKEMLLGDSSPETVIVTLPGSGSRLIGGSLQVEVSRDEVRQLLIDGFLPEISLDEKPQRRQSGFQEFGLPYAADSSITRYLAAFLTAHESESNDSESSAADHARPDIVLFNGGFFASEALRRRWLDVLESWFRSADPAWSPVILENDRLDLAVARGAAYFGMVRRGAGVRIAAGLARTYYVGVENESGKQAALCLIAAGTEPSAEPHSIDRRFDVRTSEPVQFPIFVSSTRLTDKPGSVVPIDEEQMTALPPIRTLLKTKKKDSSESVQARLSARLTEIGTMELWCQQVDSSRRWQLQFDVRSAVETEREGHVGTAEQSGIVDTELSETAATTIRAVFGPDAGESPDGLPKRLAKALEINRNDWPPSLLREIWSSLMEHEGGRKLSENHEARWLNMLGFALRPGFGMAADDWRVEETWKLLRGKPRHPGTTCEAEWWILWRRIGGGLSFGRQIELTSSILPIIRREQKQTLTGRGKGGKYASGNHAASEVWRMLGSMELLPQSTRIEIGETILDFVPRRKFETIRPALLWAFGRIGARVPVYGPLNVVISPELIERWITSIGETSDLSDPIVHLALMQMTRRTDDRYRDVSESLRTQVISWLETGGARTHFVDLVRRGGILDGDESRLVFGESLPAGLRLV
ncbi:MAG: Hsp70 family protein [Planctomycetales bacterium]